MLLRPVMPRDIRDDFRLLDDFVKTYRIASTAADPEFTRLLSVQHKRYFTLLTIVAEMRHQQFTPLPLTTTENEGRNSVFMDHLIECSSDLGMALFIWLHGAYKGARLVLRSGIENFLRAVGVTEDVAIVHARTTHEVIEIATRHTFFQSSGHRGLIGDLTDIYAELCLDVHSATFDRMEHISALGYFPNFTTSGAAGFEALFRRVADAMASTLCLMYPGVFHGMHYKNRDIVVTTLSGPVRRELADGQ